MNKRLFIGLSVLVLFILSLSTSCVSTPLSSTTTSALSQTTANAKPPPVNTTNSMSTTVSTSVPQSTAAPPSTAQAHWWDKFGTPQYGGIINIQLTALRSNFDVSASTGPGDWFMSYESLWIANDWTLDSSIYPFDTAFVPLKYFKGALAESWEMTDPSTMVVHLRQGVHWQNKAPVNGREFVASDVVNHFQRILAPGKNPTAVSQFSLVNTVTENDNYTLTVTFKKPGPIGQAQFMQMQVLNEIDPPEFAAMTAPTGSRSTPQQDWHNVAGTSPWILSDFVDGSSETYIKNPNYWGSDERYPQNKLPYAESVKGLVIPDTATALAALRTYKIDFMGSGAGGSSPINWQQAAEILKTNPELVKEKIWAGGGNGMWMNVQNPPFNDIRVRKALNMALDRPLIAKTYYGGTEDSIPAGLALPQYAGYAYPYSEWSSDLKDIYSHNIGNARSLMNAAGYPNGFETFCVASGADDLNLLQVYKAQFSEIAVNMTINVMDPIALVNYAANRKVQQMQAGGNIMSGNDPSSSIQAYLSTNSMNNSRVNDPTYDKFVADYNAAPDVATCQAIFQEADKYELENAWIVNVFPRHSYMFYTPYIKGHGSEAVMRNNWPYFMARFWIDQSLKK
jgi:peptide/nickel transport system substrate-binding protein